MTYENRQLLLKDLSARLPYGVKVEVNKDELQNYDNYWNGWSFNEGAQEIDGVYMYGITLDCMEMSNGVIPFEFIKPYLFPLSSITKEQAEDLFKTFGLILPSTEEDYIKINEVTGITFFLLQGFDVETHLDKLVDWLNKNHFDWRGLIPIGLAIDATDLNIY